MTAPRDASHVSGDWAVCRVGAPASHRFSLVTPLDDESYGTVTGTCLRVSDPGSLHGVDTHDAEIPA